MQYTVNRGDTLWRLAIRNQGSGTQWPKLVAYHNNEVAKRGPHSGLLRIGNENVIFIGQTLFLPPKAKHIKKGQGKKYPANGLAKPVNLPINFDIGHATPACKWSYEFSEAIIAAELTGTITLEMVSDNRHRHNLEIVFSRDSLEVKAKLEKLFNPVLCKLLAEPKVKFENGEVKLNSPIAAEANLGPYSIHLEPGVTPMQYSGSIKPPKINATTADNGYDYKYSAEIEYKVDVTLRPKNQPVREPVTETAKERLPQNEHQKLIRPTGSFRDWSKLALDAEEILTTVTITILSLIPQVRFSTVGMRAIMPGMYYNHSVRPGYQGYPGDA